MTPRPFLLRLIVPFGLMIALLVGVCGAVIYWVGQQTAHLQQIHDLERLTTAVRQYVPEGGPLDDAHRERLAGAGKVLGTRITLIAGEGTVLLDTDASAPGMENHNSRPEVLAARKGGIGRAVRYSHTLGEDSVYVAQLVDANQPNGRILRLSYPRHAWASLGTSIPAIVAGAIVAALLMVGLLAMLLQRQWIAPVRRLASAAERMAAGEWGQRVEPAGAEDLRFFSSRLNLVASHAQQQLADLRHQRQDLRALVDTLPDPILVSDPEGRIVLMNPPAASLLDVPPEQALGKQVVSVVTDEAILALFEQARGSKAIGALESSEADAAPSLQREIWLSRHGQRITCQAVAIQTTGGGVVLVLRDVSALVGMVQMKTDFVANASHELRTPIAAIKIAFETLRDVYADDPTQAQRCISIIDGHMERLEEMLRDLLDLSRVESTEFDPFLREVKTGDLFAALRASMGPMARQKGVDLRFGASPPQSFVGDERLLHLVLKNLVENSIKFTLAGGAVTVNATLTADPVPVSGAADGAPDVPGAAIELSVIDTGIGIPPEHLDRVFERFYQVDSARSGSAGRGTGLGLAIVKHAMSAMGGTVHVRSTVGRGTTVVCIFPNRQITEAAQSQAAL